MTPKPGELFMIKLPYESPVNGKSGLFVKNVVDVTGVATQYVWMSPYITIRLFGEDHETTWGAHMLAGMHTMEWKRKEVN